MPPVSTYVELVIIDDQGNRLTVMHDRDLRMFVEKAHSGSRTDLDEAVETIGYCVISATAKAIGVDLGWE